MLRVTEILKAVGLIDTSFLTEHGADRGTAVHETIDLDIRGDLDEDSIHPEVAPYLESFRRWRRESDGIVVLESEIELRHPVFGFMGHPDLIAKTPKLPRLIVDYKSGTAVRWHPLQTAGYALLDAFVTGAATAARAALYLHANGNAGTFVRHDERRDFELFKQALSLAHFLKG